MSALTFDMSDSFIFIKEEKTDESESAYSTIGIKEEEIPQTYYGGLIHVKQEGGIIISDDGMSDSDVIIKEEKTNISESSLPTTISRHENESRIYNAKQEKVLKSQCRELVLKIQEFFEKEKSNGGPFIKVHDVLKRTSAATQVSLRTITRISKEKYGETGSEEHALKTPGKKRPRLCPRTTMDLFQEEATRRHIYEYYQRNEYPTIARLLATLSEANIYLGSRTSLLVILKNLGFYWKRFPRNRKFLLERKDIVASRGRFLRSISKVNYDDIVWIWADDTANGTMLAQIVRNYRLILSHAGTASGLITNALLLLDGNDIPGEYHSEGSNAVFKHWFEKQVLPQIKENSIIVMDSALYQSITIEENPSPQWRKGDLKKWLESKNITFDSKMNKAELLELGKLHCRTQTSEEMDNLATKHGHSVILLPPNHSHFNPLEIIWAQIKNYIADQHKTFKSNDLLKLIHEKMEGITNSEWEKVVDNVKILIKNQTDLEDFLESRVEDMINYLNTTTDGVEEEKEINDIMLYHGEGHSVFDR